MPTGWSGGCSSGWLCERRHASGAGAGRCGCHWRWPHRRDDLPRDCPRGSQRRPAREGRACRRGVRTRIRHCFGTAARPRERQTSASCRSGSGPRRRRNSANSATGATASRSLRGPMRKRRPSRPGGSTCGRDAAILSQREISRRWTVRQGEWRAAITSPSDGGVEPGLATFRVAEAARAAGAMIIAGCAVREIETSAGRVAAVITEAGRIATEQVVCATNLWARLLCGQAGIDFPLLYVIKSLGRTQPLRAGPRRRRRFAFGRVAPQARRRLYGCLQRSVDRPGHARQLQAPPAVCADAEDPLAQHPPLPRTRGPAGLAARAALGRRRVRRHSRGNGSSIPRSIPAGPIARFGCWRRAFPNSPLRACKRCGPAPSR